MSTTGQGEAQMTIPGRDIRACVEAELAELDQKIERLAGFLGTEPYKALDKDYRVMLAQQFIAMETYAATLRARIRLHGAE